MKYRLGDARVETHPDSWIAPTAAVIGKVRLDAASASGSARCCAAITN